MGGDRHCIVGCVVTCLSSGGTRIIELAAHGGAKRVEGEADIGGCVCCSGGCNRSVQPGKNLDKKLSPSGLTFCPDNPLGLNWMVQLLL